MLSKSAGSANLLEELQTVLTHGTIARRIETLQRVTDLFLNHTVDYSDEQITLFDDVFNLFDSSHREFGESAACQTPGSRSQGPAADH